MTLATNLDSITSMITGREDSSQETEDAVVEELEQESLEDADLVDSDAEIADDDHDDDEDLNPPEGETDEEEPTQEAPPYLDVTDEDLIEVKIDGEVTYRTLGEAKKALSGEGAVEKRLKEVTTLRNELYRAQQSGTAELEDRRNQLFTVVQHLEQFLSTPSVPKPDEQLRFNDPQAYLQQLDLYNAEVGRLSQVRAQLQKNMQAQLVQRQHNEKVMRERTERELMERIPQLKDEAQQKTIINRIVETARSYGFTNEEMGQFFDARAYQMVHDLAALRESRQQTKVTKDTKEPQQKPRVPKRLRSGVAAKVAKDAAKQKARKQAVDRARKSGKVDDVTMAILKPAPRR